MSYRDDRPHVAVLTGGIGPHHERSLESGVAVIHALESLGYPVSRVDYDAELLVVLRSRTPDVVFNALHGAGMGPAQALLDWLELPYTGTGMLGSALAADLHLCKKLIAAEGLSTPSWEIFDLSAAELPLLPGSLGLPLRLRSRHRGSMMESVLVQTHEAWANAVIEAGRLDVEVLLAESAVRGRRVAVGVLGDLPLGVIDVETGDAAELDESLTERVQALALSTHRFLGFRDYSHTSILLGEDGHLMILAGDPTPDFTPLSSLARSAAIMGTDFPSLIGRIVALARDREALRASRNVIVTEA